MLRNLYITNGRPPMSTLRRAPCSAADCRDRLFTPTRVWRKITGPLELTLIAQQIGMNKTTSTAMPTEAIPISAMRLAAATRRQRRPYSMEPTPPGLERDQSPQWCGMCQVRDRRRSGRGGIVRDLALRPDRPGNMVGCQL